MVIKENITLDEYFLDYCAYMLLYNIYKVVTGLVMFLFICRYNCNRYDEKEAQAARDAQAVSRKLYHFFFVSQLGFL